MRIWIDTDAGVDDATAILICLACKDVEIVGISCVGGNASLKNVIHNVNRSCNVYGNKDVPIYAGASHAILEEPMVIPEIHGKDGCGDIDDKKFGINVPDRVGEKHAVNALCEALTKYDDIHVLCLAPLTNIALAARMNPTAFMRIKQLVIMGCAEDGKGNTNPYAEYNIRADPHAAQIIFSTFPQDKTVVASWTLTLKYKLPTGKHEQITELSDTKLQRFIHDIWQVLIKYEKDGMTLPDPLAAFCICYPKHIKKVDRLRINIVLDGEKIGMSEVKADPNGCHVVKEIDQDAFIKVIKDMMLSREGKGA